MGPVQQTVMRLCEMSAGSEVLLKPNEGRAAKRLETQGRVATYRDGFGVWAKLVPPMKADGQEK
jgi:hypothetical protein